jgi:hypothetical protein
MCDTIEEKLPDPKLCEESHNFRLGYKIVYKLLRTCLGFEIIVLGFYQFHERYANTAFINDFLKYSRLTLIE